VLIASALLAAVAGAPASAEPVPMAAQHQDKSTRDGWQLSLQIDHELVNSVPNLANATNSREAFVTFSATATAVGGSTPITDSTVVAGYQLGCQSDVSSGLGVGGAGAFGPSASIGGPLAALRGESSGNVGIAGGLTGFVQTIIQPGVIVEVPMANMPIGPNGSAMLDIDNIHIKADACGGDVTIRSYCYLRISTGDARNEFAIYGDPIKI
jgi:MspA